jgi:hypothetical protein
MATVRHRTSLIVVVATGVALAGCSSTPSVSPTGTYTATFIKGHLGPATAALTLNANGSFDFPAYRSPNGQLHLSGSWQESNGIVTMSCLTGVVCSAHPFHFTIKQLGKNLGSPSTLGTIRFGSKRLETWYAVRS